MSDFLGIVGCVAVAIAAVAACFTIIGRRADRRRKQEAEWHRQDCEDA